MITTDTDSSSVHSGVLRRRSMSCSVSLLSRDVPGIKCFVPLMTVNVWEVGVVKMNHSERIFMDDDYGVLALIGSDSSA